MEKNKKISEMIDEIENIEVKPEEKSEENSKENSKEDYKEKSDKKEETKGDKKAVKKLEAELEKAKKEIEAKEAEIKESQSKYLTMLAEYDNFRRRSAKEKESTYSDAYGDVLTQILPVIDNLERAAGYSDGESILKGLELTLKSFKEILEKLSIKEIECVGKTFDPNTQNAVMHIEDEAYGEGEVVEVLQKGYMYGDKVLRFAMVKVAN